ncbi:hypothetical protein BYI23_C000500 [Burkholderia sp. YI23]|uniref:Preprotein translocase subunit SecA n=1 Tax=Caballeronia cordobensis TaxID=1353886 RepID=A0A158IT96_CABCO|nr:hypothetical protein [Caballeronia cordobensis]AET92196.1 hypothetical protein BYI23_C000500 [Burkholderia sp. YI23]SAL59725.1 hypothetical protein AWB70_05369 [Caballeronia cordobensis]
MLSPHEIAALMLLDTNPIQSGLDLDDLDALCERQLVLLEAMTSGGAHHRVTEQGRALLRSVSKYH